MGVGGRTEPQPSGNSTRILKCGKSFPKKTRAYLRADRSEPNAGPAEPHLRPGSAPAIESAVVRRLAPTVMIALGLGLAFGIGLARWSAYGARSPLALGAVGDQVREALAEEHRLERVAALAALLPRIPVGGLDALLAAYQEAPLNAGDVEFVPLAAWWTAFDPDAARRWTQVVWHARYRRVVEAVFREWGRTEPSAAIARVRELKGPLLRELSTAALFVGADEARLPPAEIGALLRLLPPGSDRQAAVRALVRRRLPGGDAKRTLAWAEELMGSDDAIQGDVVLGTVSALADRWPDLAAAWVMAQPGDVREIPADVALALAERWIRRDPDAAMGWLATLPPGPERDTSVKLVFRAWRLAAPEAARAWIEPRVGSVEPWLEPALDIHVRVLSSEDPALAIDQAGRLSRERIRDGAQAAILRYWLSRDPEAAEAWLQSAELAPERDATLRAAASAPQPRGIRVRGVPAPAQAGAERAEPRPPPTSQ